MSTADTWMPLYVGDYLADTGHLSACEHGAYLLLLMHYWRNGPLPDNDKQLAAIARLDRKTWVSDVGPTIREFFVLEDGRLHQKRADQERAKWADISAKRREAGKAGAQAKHHPKPPDPPLANARQTDGKCQHEPPDPPLANASHPGGKCQDFASDLPPHLNLNQEEERKSTLLPECGAPAIAVTPGTAPEVVLPDPREELWQQGVRLVQGLTGMMDRPARSLLGKLVQLAQDDCAHILAILHQCDEQRPLNPTAWLVANAKPFRNAGLALIAEEGIATEGAAALQRMLLAAEAKGHA